MFHKFTALKFTQALIILVIGTQLLACGGGGGSSGIVRTGSVSDTESSIAAGVRRIEAITAEAAEEFVNNQLVLLNDVKSLLKDPKDLVQAITYLQEEKNALSKGM